MELCSSRHCAFCLVLVPAQFVLFCPRCKKRAYCSMTCQLQDWAMVRGAGQGHKNWCSLYCGEEDLDWEVKAAPGKGLGLFAKRDYKANTRILVDGVRSEDHPAIKYLMPAKGTLAEKRDLNSIEIGDETGLFLRVSRVNHACYPNASYAFDDKLKAMILFAEREIKEGEEICMNYRQRNLRTTNEKSADEVRSFLLEKYGIACPDNCFCRDEKMEKNIRKAKALHGKIMKLKSEGKVTEALEAVQKLSGYNEITHASWVTKQQTCFMGFEIAIMKSAGLNLAQVMIEMSHAILASITSPQSEYATTLAGYMKDMSSHPNYLRLERGRGQAGGK